MRECAVRGRATGRHEITAHAHGHQQIDHVANVHVTDFPFAHTKLDTTEAMG